MNTKRQRFVCVCVCVWFRFTGWEQCGAAALSSHQAGVQEINVYYLGKKEIKSQLDPWSAPSADVFSDSGHLHLNAHWCQRFLVVMQLREAIPSGLRYLLMRWHSKQWCKQHEPWDAFCLSIPLGMLLSLPRPSASPESPKHLAFSTALFKQPHHFP